MKLFIVTVIVVQRLKEMIFKSSYSDLGLSFTYPDYAYGFNEAQPFLAGSYNFQVIEVEVYIQNNEKNF